MKTRSPHYSHIQIRVYRYISLNYHYFHIHNTAIHEYLRQANRFYDDRFWYDLHDTTMSLGYV